MFYNNCTRLNTYSREALEQYKSHVLAKQKQEESSLLKAEVEALNLWDKEHQSIFNNNTNSGHGEEKSNNNNNRMRNKKELFNRNSNNNGAPSAAGQTKKKVQL